MRNLITFIFSLFFSAYCYGQQTLSKNTDPYKVQFVTSDITNFWIAYDACKISPENSVALYDQLYFGKGSAGLPVFKKSVIGPTADFVKTIEKYRLYYESIRGNTLKISALKPAMLKSLVKLKELYPAAVFPDVYMEMGNLSSGGRSLKEGLFIGADINCADSSSDFTNVSPQFVKVLKSMTLPNIPVLVAHELVHYQQNYSDTSKTVLSRAIIEGSADFICKLAMGTSASKLLHEYGQKHEQELWNEFKNDLNNTNVFHWFYYKATPERPADLGYYVGFKIAEAYYLRSPDKHKAIEEILNVKNFSSFLEQSGYEKKFN